MITPIFWLTQEPDFLIVRIRAPHANLAELDLDYGQQMFIFSCQPYFLRLHLKQMVDEYANGMGKVSYDSDLGEFLVHLPKMHKNEHFTDLDMITELLRPSRETQIHGRGMVEEVGDDNEEEDEEEEEEDPEGNEYLIDQEVRDLEKERKEDLRIEKEFGYGFGWTKIGVIERLRGEIGAIVDLDTPEEVAIEKRSGICSKRDFEAFDEGRYLADTLEPEDELLEIISSAFKIPLEISDEDREKLKDLSTKKRPAKMGPQIEKSVAISLVDLVFAYCYDQRINQWESSCESGWNCAKLSTSLSFLARFSDVEKGVLASFRRVICYPLYRSWQLAVKVLEDVRIVFGKGRSALLHILCDLHRIFINSGEFRYILNDLFITDYLIWIQSADQEIIDWIQKEVDKLEAINKSKFEWDLEMIELDAKMGQVLDSDDDPE